HSACLLPYTTLFRSRGGVLLGVGLAGQEEARLPETGDAHRGQDHHHRDDDGDDGAGLLLRWFAARVARLLVSALLVGRLRRAVTRLLLRRRAVARLLAVRALWWVGHVRPLVFSRARTHGAL